MATEALAESATTKGSSSHDRAIVRINRAIALKRLGCTAEMMDDLSLLEQNGDTVEANIKAGVAALKGNKEEMFAARTSPWIKLSCLNI